MTETLDQKTLHVNTICRNCIFAKFNDEYTVQTGCELNRIDKFIERGLCEIVTDEETDLSYYKINTICNACRDTRWANKLEDPKVTTLKQIQIKTDIIVFDYDENNNWIDNIKETLDSIKRQTMKPTKIIVGVYQKKEACKSIMQKLNDFDISNEVVNVLQDCSFGRFLDELVRKVRGQYYMLCKAGSILQPDQINLIDKSINIDLLKISMIEESERVSGLVVQKLLHDTVGGNNNLLIQEKVHELAANQNLKHMIKSWDEIL